MANPYFVRIGSRYINLANCYVDLAATHYFSTYEQDHKGAPPSAPAVRIVIFGDTGEGATELEFYGENYLHVRARLEQALNSWALIQIDLAPAKENDPAPASVEKITGHAIDPATGLLRGGLY